MNLSHYCNEKVYKVFIQLARAAQHLITVSDQPWNRYNYQENKIKYSSMTTQSNDIIDMEYEYIYIYIYLYLSKTYLFEKFLKKVSSWYSMIRYRTSISLIVFHPFETARLNLHRLHSPLPYCTCEKATMSELLQQYSVLPFVK